MEKQHHCLNCEAQVNGKYCFNCGQKVDLTRINFKEIGADFLGALVNYDAPFPKTFLQLFYNPGKLGREYLAGKRKTYYSAVRYLIICLAFSILVVELLEYDPVGLQMRLSEQELNEMNDDVSVIAGRLLHKNINFFIFIFPFTIGLLSKLFFRKAKYNLTEMTAYGFYIAGQFLILNSVFIPIIIMYPPFFNIGTYLILIYIAFAIYNFFQPRKKVLGILKSFFAALLAFFSYGFIAFLVAIFLVEAFNLS